MTMEYIVRSAPEVFVFAAMAIGAYFGRMRIRGFAIGAAACTLVAAVPLGLLGEFVIPPILRSILFALFVFGIGYRAGPEFFASLSLKTLNQVVLALSIGLTGFVCILVLAHLLKLDPGTAAGIGAGGLTQTAMMGTAISALSQMELSADVIKQQQANVAAGYAVTYVCGYILVLLFVPLVAPLLMRVDLKEEAKKLEAELAGSSQQKLTSLIYRKFQARAYLASSGAGQSVAAIEQAIGRRSVIEKIVRQGEAVALSASTLLNQGDHVVVVGPSSAIILADERIGPEVESEELLRSIEGEVVEVYLTNRNIHGRSIGDFVAEHETQSRAVFMRSLLRHGEEVPIMPGTRLYVGDIATLVGTKSALGNVVPLLGQRMGNDHRSDIAFIAFGLALGLLAGLLSVQVGPVMLTLGGAGGALVAGLISGWYTSKYPTTGAFPPLARETVSDIGLAGFIACIGLANGQAALDAVQAHGLTLLLAGIVVTIVPMIVGTLIAYYLMAMNPVIICGAMSGAMTVDAAVAGCCDVAESQMPLLGVAVPYAVSNVILTVLGPLIIALV